MSQSTERPNVRRSTFSYAVIGARCPDYNRRAAWARFGWLGLAALGLSAAHAPEWTWIAIVLGVAGAALTLAVARHEIRQTSSRNVLVRWTHAISDATTGTARWNVPGATEFVTALALLALGPWAMQFSPDMWRLVVLAAAVGYGWNFLSNVLLDPYMYNPAEPNVKWFESGRSVAGILAALLGLAVVIPAPWTPEMRPVAVGVVVTIVILQLRIRETDRLLVEAEQQSKQDDIQNRKAITEPLHGLIGAAIEQLVGHASQRSNGQVLDDAYLHDMVMDLYARYAQVIELEAQVSRTIEWPETLIGPLSRVVTTRGIAMARPRLPDKPIPVPDVDLVRSVLMTLAANVARNGANYSEFSVELVDDRYVVTAFDDGAPILGAAWLRPGGGLDRLRVLHQKVNLTAGYSADATSIQERIVPGKLVTVSWRASHTFFGAGKRSNQ